LLHEALREVLGNHVEQKGSHVSPGGLRFDFSHFSKMTPEELFQVQNKVTQKIYQALRLEEDRALDIEKAKSKGAMALFGEKYGDKVRVIKFGSSVELCGGTHVQNTADIMIFKIMSESAVASGIRRIEAITGLDVINYYQSIEANYDKIKDAVKSTSEPLKAIADLQTQNAELQKKLEVFNREKAGSLKKELVNAGEDVKGIKLITKQVDLDNASIKDLAFQLKAEMKNTVMLLATNADGKPTLNVMVTDDLVSGKKLHAGNLVKELAKCINGGGGGAPFFATAGGTNAEGIQQALHKIRELI
jgi:alanyl-tRNA synthetase